MDKINELANVAHNRKENVWRLHTGKHKRTSATSFEPIINKLAHLMWQMIGNEYECVCV